MSKYDMMQYMSERTSSSPANVNGYFNEELCRKCGGKCCFNGEGFVYSCEDLGLSRELDESDQKSVDDAMDKIMSAMDRNPDMYVENYVTPELRLKDGTIQRYEVIVIAARAVAGRCVNCSETGCIKTRNKRPELCRKFEPLSGGYNDENKTGRPCSIMSGDLISICAGWLPYQKMLQYVNILRSILATKDKREEK